MLEKTHRDLFLDQGADFSHELPLLTDAGEPIDASGWTARAAMRRHYQSANSVTLSATLGDGTLTLSLTAEQTANVEPGRYVWDAYVVDDADATHRLAEGHATVSPGVSRE